MSFHDSIAAKGRPLWLGAGLALALLGACGQNDLERGAVGATIGGVGAAVTGGSVVQGAALGGAAGALCNSAGLC